MIKTESRGTVTIEDDATKDTIVVDVAEAVTSNLTKDREVTVARLTDDSFFIGMKGFTEDHLSMLVPREAFASLLSTLVLFTKADQVSEALFNTHMQNFVGYDLTEKLKDFMDNVDINS